MKCANRASAYARCVNTPSSFSTSTKMRWSAVCAKAEHRGAGKKIDCCPSSLTKRKGKYGVGDSSAVFCGTTWHDETAKYFGEPKQKEET